MSSEFVQERHEFAGHTIVVQRRNVDEDCVDPHLFDEDYTAATSTGFTRVWDGTWLLLHMLAGEIGAGLRGKRVVELGSGTGLAGLCAAALGCHVLLTDVPSVTNGVLLHNIALNARPCARVPENPGPLRDEARDCMSTPASVGPGAAPRGIDDADCVRCDGGAGDDGRDGVGRAWGGAVEVGDGSAAALALDWTLPIEQQLGGRESAEAERGGRRTGGEAPRSPGGCVDACDCGLGRPSSGAGPVVNDPREADAVIACEVIWLKELVEPFVRTVAHILCGPRRPPCYMTYTHRGTARSTVFAYEQDVLAEFVRQGCCVHRLDMYGAETDDGERVSAWRVTMSGDQRVAGFV